MKGFTKSLRGRLAAYFALSIFISLLISGLLAGVLVQRYLKQKTISDMKTQVETLANQIETEGLPQRRYIADLERMYQTRAIIAPYSNSTLGNLPQPGPPEDLAEPNSRLLPELDWNLLKDGGTQVKETDLPEVERDVFVVAHGFKAGDEFAGAVVLAKPVRLLQSWHPLVAEFIIAAAVSLAVSLLLSLLLARRLSRPLHEITLAATAVAEGDFSRELTVRSSDEIGRLADAFRHMTAEVRQSQEQQRQFVINVSHELKTPLTAIAGHAQALEDGIADDPEAVAKSLGVVLAETSRLSRLIGDLLSLAKFDARQFELRSTSVEVADVIGQVIDGLARDAAERKIELRLAGAPADSAAGGPGAITLTTDPDRLRQILSNLVQNALTHTASGGKVTISARVAEGDAIAGAASRKIEIEVADDGAGIDPAGLPYIFDRFYRARKGAHGAGLGLGLSISRDLARAMGGDISVVSEAGKGSRFTVSLPSQGQANF